MNIHSFGLFVSRAHIAYSFGIIFSIDIAYFRMVSRALVSRAYIAYCILIWNWYQKLILHTFST